MTLRRNTITSRRSTYSAPAASNASVARAVRIPIALASTEYEDEALQPLGDDGYLVYLGSHRDVSDERLAAAVTAQLTRPRALRVMRFPTDDAWLWQELQGVATAGTPNGL